MVKKLVNKFELFMCFKHLPEHLDTVGFYFLRTQIKPIAVPSSLEQAKSDLPSCFEMGTIGHNPLNAVEKMLTHIYVPLLMIQGTKHGEGGGGE